MSSKRILIVDDDEAILEALSLAAEMEGYEVASTPNIEEVVPKINSFTPDLLILDVLLNGGDGRDVCQIIKHNGKTRQLPVLMISAHPQAAKTVKNFGADDFLAKPFDINVLLGKINSLLQRY